MPTDRQMNLARPRHVLLLLDALGGSAGNIDFQKLLFLYCQEPNSGQPYDFVPYKYGAFSYTSYADRRRLIKSGLLADLENQWQLTEEGRMVAAQTRDLNVADFADRHRSLRGDALVAETYRRFPYYAIRSEIAPRVLRSDWQALVQIEEARPAEATARIQTIGYEDRTLESYLNTLLRSGVTLLCDVRRNALSRKYGFSKGTLSSACEGVGIRYEHLPELGIASSRRQALRSQDDYDALFDDYEQTMLPREARALAVIVDWVREGGSIALTCYEKTPDQCHRHCVAQALEHVLGKDFAARHL